MEAKHSGTELKETFFYYSDSPSQMFVEFKVEITEINHSKPPKDKKLNIIFTFSCAHVSNLFFSAQNFFFFVIVFDRLNL